jgi:hypothetical protein
MSAYLIAALLAAAEDDWDRVNAIAELAGDGPATPDEPDGLGDPSGEAAERVAGYAADYVTRSLRKDTGEGCVPNNTGPGHHDSETGRPCSKGDKDAGGKGGKEKAAGKRDSKTNGARPAPQKAPKKAPRPKGQQAVDLPVQMVGGATARGLAEALGPVTKDVQFVPGSKPQDIELRIGDQLHGIECKAFVTTKKQPLAVKMGRLTRLEKEDWEEKNNAVMHTVMVDHRARWKEHGEATATRVQPGDMFPCYYRRGGSNGPATDPPALLVKTPADLVKVMALSDEELAAQFEGRGVRPKRLKGSPEEDAIRKRGSKR